MLAKSQQSESAIFIQNSAWTVKNLLQSQKLSTNENAIIWNHISEQKPFIDLGELALKKTENSSRDVAVIWVGRQKAKCQKNQ